MPRKCSRIRAASSAMTTFRGPLVAQTSIGRLAQPCGAEDTRQRTVPANEPVQGVRRRASLCLTRPVTPELAGSSPVAPVENILQIKAFCCQSWRRRPPVSHRPPALILHAKQSASETENCCKPACSVAGLGAWKGNVPQSSRADPARGIAVLRFLASSRQPHSGEFVLPTD